MSAPPAIASAPSVHGGARIVSTPDVLGGAWRIEGTRIPARAIREFREAGYDTAAIIREYPGLTPAQVEAAAAFVAPVEPWPARVRRMRKALGMTQAEFARTLRLPLATLVSWESGISAPRGHEATLLVLVERIPEAVIEALGEDGNG